MTTKQRNVGLNALVFACGLALLCGVSAPTWGADLKVGVDLSLTGGTDDAGRAIVQQPRDHATEWAVWIQ